MTGCNGVSAHSVVRVLMMQDNDSDDGDDFA